MSRGQNAINFSCSERGDGAHHSASNPYPEWQAALAVSLASGKPFNTGWWGVKKEIVSFCVSQDKKGGPILAEASVSDDFDDVGTGEIEAEERTLEAVLEALDKAETEANENIKDNQTVLLYSVGQKGAWEYTYLVPTGDGVGMDVPPGDNYYKWGWQETPAKISSATRKKIVKAIEDWEVIDAPVNERGRHVLVIGTWTIQIES